MSTKTTTKPEPIRREAVMFAAVRRDDSHDWIDRETLSDSENDARKRAREWNTMAPNWGEANPVCRVVRVRVTLEEIGG